MKTSLEIPDELVREVKILAAKEGKKLKEIVAESLADTLRRRGAQGRPSLREIRSIRVGGPIRQITSEDDLLGEMMDERRR